jgi:hypothetical protein
MSSTFRALTSITNPVVKELVRLRESRRFRRTARSTLVSGARVLEEIVKQSATTPLRRLLVTDAALASPALSAAAGEVFIVTSMLVVAVFFTVLNQVLSLFSPFVFVRRDYAENLQSDAHAGCVGRACVAVVVCRDWLCFE